MIFFLIGQSGSGKSYWARTLAPILNFAFFDTDEMIADEVKQPVTAIFSKHGELFFRETEREVLHKILSHRNNNAIVATGGGMPAYADNMDFMLRNGTVLYLEAPVAILADRLKNASGRPLLTGSKEPLNDILQRQLDKRQAIYQRAHYKVDITTATSATFAAIIRSAQNQK